jgi:hypothetical protein
MNSGSIVDGSLTALDQQVLDCDPLPLSRFRLVESENNQVSFDYNCQEMEAGVSRTAGYIYHSGFQSDGGSLYLDRQHAICPDNTLMSHLEVASSFGSLEFVYTCSAYSVLSYECNNQYTDWQPAGSAESLLSLVKHDVTCPTDTAMKGFEGESKYDDGFSFRFHYLVLL